ncbi:MAG: DUF924 domain-containing protein [Alphaproteobacteria bacterium]|nr:DUF924 domain-containing protein [Alphaproteobacteria bacterium]
MTAAPEAVIRFWTEAGPDKWYKKDTAFDTDIRTRFLGTYEAGAAGRLADWERPAQGALALVIVLDQFPRNMFRGNARAFAADPLAREVAGRAIANGFDTATPLPLRQFFYLPYEHSEKLADQERAVELFRSTGNGELVKWAVLHLDIVRRFGRFPHRNAVLGRATTPDEQTFLDGGGFAG